MLCVVGIVLGAGLAAAVYELTLGPTLSVIDGSIVGVIEGDFTNYSSTAPLSLNFSATTYVNQTAGLASTLTLQLRTWTYYDATAGAEVVNVNLTISGRFASDLQPRNLDLTCNLSGPAITLTSAFWFPNHLNVSYDPNSGISLSGNTSGSQSAGLIGQGGPGPYRFFVYSEKLIAVGRTWWNHFLGLRASVTGLSSQVGVGVLLKVIDVPGGRWP